MRPTALFGGTFPNESTEDNLSCRRSVRRGYFQLSETCMDSNLFGFYFWQSNGKAEKFFGDFGWLEAGRESTSSCLSDSLPASILWTTSIAAVPKDLVPHSSRRVKGERYIYSGRPEWIDMGPVNEIVNEALQNRKRRDIPLDSRP